MVLGNGRIYRLAPVGAKCRGLSSAESWGAKSLHSRFSRVRAAWAAFPSYRKKLRWMSKLALNVLVYAIRARGRMAALPRRNLESFLYNGEDSCSGPPSFHH